MAPTVLQVYSFRVSMNGGEILYRSSPVTCAEGAGHVCIQSTFFLLAGLHPRVGLGSQQPNAVGASSRLSAQRCKRLFLRRYASSLPATWNKGGEASPLGLRKESPQPSSYQGRDCKQALACSELLERGNAETQEARDQIRSMEDRVPEDSVLEDGVLEDSPLVSRVLERLNKVISGEEAGAGAASVVEALLQLDLSNKEVEAIITKNSPLFHASFLSKTAHSSNVAEMVDCLLAFQLTRKEVGRIFRKDPLLLSTKDCRVWADAIEFLRDEVKVERMPKVLMLYPNILRLKVTKLRATVSLLRDEFGIHSMVRLVETCPALLGGKLESLREKCVNLRQILGVQDLGPLLDRHPGLLLVGPTVPAAAAEWLVATLGEETARRVLLVNPQLLTGKAQTYEQKLGSLRAMLPAVDLRVLILRNPQILATSTETVRGSFACLAETFGEAAAAAMVLKNPRVLHVSAALLRARLEFCTRAMGWSLLQLASTPGILALSLEGTLEPRYAALRRLGLARSFAPSTIFNTSKREFERRLVLWAQPKYDKFRQFDEVNDNDDVDDDTKGNATQLAKCARSNEGRVGCSRAAAAAAAPTEKGLLSSSSDAGEEIWQVSDAATHERTAVSLSDDMPTFIFEGEVVQGVSLWFPRDRLFQIPCSLSDNSSHSSTIRTYRDR
eukprot:jgi/Mesen1/1864/ME000143S00921